MRPGIEWLERRARIPRPIGLFIHYAVLIGLVALALWLLVPRAIDQVQQATSGNALHQSAQHSSGIKHQLLSSLDKRLRRLPSGLEARPPGRRDHEDGVRGPRRDLLRLRRRRVLDLRARPDDRARPVDGASKARRVIRDTWILIDQKLGSFVRGQLILVVFVAGLLSAGFFAIGLRTGC